MVVDRREFGELSGLDIDVATEDGTVFLRATAGPMRIVAPPAECKLILQRRRPFDDLWLDGAELTYEGEFGQTLRLGGPGTLRITPAGRGLVTLRDRARLIVEAGETAIRVDSESDDVVLQVTRGARVELAGRPACISTAKAAWEVGRLGCSAMRRMRTW